MILFIKTLNLIGRRIYHFLFLVSTLLMCKACAQYFFYVEKNLKCPICELLKSVRKTTQVSISFAECTNYSIAVPTIKIAVQEKQQVSYTFSSKVAYQYLLFKKRQFQNHNVSYPKEVEKLYLLFCQLKIGNCC